MQVHAASCRCAPGPHSNNSQRQAIPPHGSQPPAPAVPSPRTTAPPEQTVRPGRDSRWWRCHLLHRYCCCRHLRHRRCRPPRRSRCHRLVRRTDRRCDALLCPARRWTAHSDGVRVRTAKVAQGARLRSMIYHSPPGDRDLIAGPTAKARGPLPATAVGPLGRHARVWQRGRHSGSVKLAPHSANRSSASIDVDGTSRRGAGAGALSGALTAACGCHGSCNMGQTGSGLAEERRPAG